MSASPRPFAARGRFGIPLALALAILPATGCRRKEEAHAPSVSAPPTVRIVNPNRRDIVRVVGQPSFIESYERASIYPKLIGYIEKWNVDIGDKVKKGDVLATLFVPELLEDFKTKKAIVVLDERRVELSREVVEVADANVKAAQAELTEAKAILGKYQAEVDRWDVEVKRLDEEVKRGVVDPQILLESTNQWKSSVASRNAARAAIDRAAALLISSEANLAAAQVGVTVAEADLAVATSEAKRIEAWVGYISLTAPYDGVIVTRNANTGDFVMPSSGDPTALSRSPNLAPGGIAAPIYTVDRTDIVRIFMDVPEQDANYVQIGSKASVLVRAFRDDPIPGSVTRTSWALNIKSRTLRAEIDLPNPESRLLPNMYAYAKVIIERPNVPALPAAAFVHMGEKTFCWMYRDGRAFRTEVRTGVDDGDWHEVTSFLHGSDSRDLDSWKPPDGTEKVILGDLSTLAEGDSVEIATEDGKTEATSPAPAPPQPRQSAISPTQPPNPTAGGADKTN